MVDYAERVNRGIDHIVRQLAQPLKLEEVARAAGLSPFHFHRIFKGLLGETLNQFVKRQRLERALYLMSHAPERSLTDVALDCGFASSSDFSRSFKKHDGQAPSVFDLRAFRTARREEFERLLAGQQASSRLADLPSNHNPDGFEARGLADGQWLGYMWDEPEVVALAQCRYDVALVIDAPEAFEPAGGIGRFDFPPMRVAEVAVKGDIALEVRALDRLYKTWLPRSGYVPDDLPAFEAWAGRPFADGNAHFELACQLPVKRA